MGTREGIFNLPPVNERYLEKHKYVYICFIDYEKAFDRVMDEKLCEVLTAMNFDLKDVRTIANLHWGHVAVVRTKKGIFFFFFFFYINVNLKLNKIQYSVPSIAEKDMTSSGSGYERHLQFL